MRVERNLRVDRRSNGAGLRVFHRGPIRTFPRVPHRQRRPRTAKHNCKHRPTSVSAHKSSGGAAGPRPALNSAPTRYHCRHWRHRPTPPLAAAPLVARPASISLCNHYCNHCLVPLREKPVRSDAGSEDSHAAHANKARPAWTQRLPPTSTPDAGRQVLRRSLRQRPPAALESVAGAAASLMLLAHDERREYPARGVCHMEACRSEQERCCTCCCSRSSRRLTCRLVENGDQGNVECRAAFGKVCRLTAAT